MPEPATRLNLSAQPQTTTLPLADLFTIANAHTSRNPWQHSSRNCLDAAPEILSRSLVRDLLFPHTSQETIINTEGFVAPSCNPVASTCI